MKPSFYFKYRKMCRKVLLSIAKAALLKYQDMSKIELDSYSSTWVASRQDIERSINIGLKAIDTQLKLM